ncbi:MAG: IPT/TIG domain-containing protein, partial [Polyangia bacterium]
MPDSARFQSDKASSGPLHGVPFRTAATGVMVGMTVALAGAVLVPLCGCAPSRRPPNVSSVNPVQAYTDHPVVLRVNAGELRPSLKLDLASQQLTTDLMSVRIALIPEEAGPESPAAIPLETIDWDGAWNGDGLVASKVGGEDGRGGQEDAFWARTPPDVPAGRYAVRVTDPRGQASSLAQAFLALGADVTPPTIALESEPALLPDSLSFGEKTIHVRIVADDGLGSIVGVNWSTSEGSAGACTFGPPPSGSSAPLAATIGAPQLSTALRQPSLSRAVCPADVVLPAVPGDGPTIVPFWFHAEARDGADHQTALDISLRIARLARIVGFASAVGGLAGNQSFVVRGRDFLPGSQALVDGVPILPPVPGGTPGGELRDDKPGQAADGVSNQSGGSNQSIAGMTPPRANPGVVPVEVRSPAGTVTSRYGFSYVGPPNIRDVQPTTGPRAGGNRIVIKGNDLRYDAVVYIGPTRQGRV